MTMMMNSVARAGLAAALADFIAELTYEALPEEARNEARRAIADTVGGAIAACSEPSTLAVRQVIAGEAGPCSIWGTTDRTTPRNAALVNGTMAHAHDIDDCNGPMLGHPSAPVVPAIAALVDELRLPGADMVVAYVAAVEVEGRLGRAVTLRHNALGWHTTSTLGCLGAAAACAKLLKLDGPGILAAMGIAASLASGVRQNFGTMTKPAHAGFAAQNGLLAARLAQAGMTASAEAIEGHEGFMDLFVGKEVLAEQTSVGRFGEPFELIHNYYKIYPTCSLVQCGLDIVLAGIASGDIVPDDVKTLRAGVSYHALNIMRYHDPKDALQARFSMEYCLAAALSRGRVGIDEFAEEAVFAPEIRDRMRQVEPYVHPDLATRDQFDRALAEGNAFTDIEVTHGSGHVFRRRASVAKGTPENPVSWGDLEAKFRMCVTPQLGEDTTEILWNNLRKLGEEEASYTRLLRWNN
ncbi:MmgE/PrpD family protein [Roseomonas sp. ACRSG]|nr:MmgE/PrpD family protein [Roseomonas sp. ACRSG]